MKCTRPAQVTRGQQLSPAAGSSPSAGPLASHCARGMPRARLWDGPGREQPPSWARTGAPSGARPCLCPASAARLPELWPDPALSPAALSTSQPRGAPVPHPGAVPMADPAGSRGPASAPSCTSTPSLRRTVTLSLPQEHARNPSGTKGSCLSQGKTTTQRMRN